MKRKILKLTLLVLLCANYILLSLRWAWWMLDDKYGVGERLRAAHAFGDSLNVNNELRQIYTEIQIDLLYFAIFTLVVYLVFAAFLNTYTRGDVEQ